ncbi:hypothetical protein [Anaeromyxobacter dehalogenans]|uniref:hypothetical protein n=1 Tax=Anaeromyxobacter dehalogenans TaxID=161493 RepID=UPI0002D43A00|nr:hypothetical protein [Anaeromyxobacter dehalogenans]
MTARSRVAGLTAACLLAALAACSAPRATTRASAVAAQGAEAGPGDDLGRPRVRLLAPCEDAGGAGGSCAHRHPVLEVTY